MPELLKTMLSIQVQMKIYTVCVCILVIVIIGVIQAKIHRLFPCLCFWV